MSSANPTVTSSVLAIVRDNLLDVWDLYEKNAPNYWKAIIGKEIRTHQIYEEFATFVGLGPAQKTREAGGVPFDQPLVPYVHRIQLEKYAIGVEFSEELNDKDIYGKMRAPGRMMSESHDWAHEIMAADVLNNAVSSGVTGYDSKSFAATDHNASGISFSNKGTAEALSVGALETAITSLKRQVSFRGRPMAAMGPWKLVVAPELEITARRILNVTEGRPGSSDADYNYAPSQITQVVVNPYLTDTNAWYLLPMGEKNPIRQLNGMPMISKEDYDIDHFVQRFATAREMTTFWLPPYGTWVNEGA